MNKNFVLSVLFVVFNAGCGEVLLSELDAQPTDGGEVSDSSGDVVLADASGQPTVVDAGVPDAMCQAPTSINLVEFLGAPSQLEFVIASIPGLVITAQDPTLSTVRVSLSEAWGLGVEGGYNDSSIDDNEVIIFTFDTRTTTNVTFNVIGARDGDGDGVFGTAQVEAFDSECNSLGTVVVFDNGLQNVSGLFGGEPISMFSVKGHDGDRLRIEYLTFQCEACDCSVINRCAD